MMIVADTGAVVALIDRDNALEAKSTSDDGLTKVSILGATPHYSFVFTPPHNSI